MRPLHATIALLVPSLAAPEEGGGREGRPQLRPGFEFEFAFAGGDLEHRTDGSDLDGKTDAALVRFHFEAVGRGGNGGGIRFEFLASDDALFDDAGFPGIEAELLSFYLHFTHRVSTRHFQMPLRIGLLSNFYKLEEDLTDDAITYWSIGPYFEIAPEAIIIDKRQFSWSLYTELGAGAGATFIDVDNDSNNYYSYTTFAGAEVGTRFRAGPMRFGIGFLGRWHWMDESDTEDGITVLGYDSEFVGFIISGSAVF
jgi:hypothetical protein